MLGCVLEYVAHTWRSVDTCRSWFKSAYIMWNLGTNQIHRLAIKAFVLWHILLSTKGQGRKDRDWRWERNCGLSEQVSDHSWGPWGWVKTISEMRWHSAGLRPKYPGQAFIIIPHLCDVHGLTLRRGNKLCEMQRGVRTASSQPLTLVDFRYDGYLNL